MALLGRPGQARFSMAGAKANDERKRRPLYLWLSSPDGDVSAVTTEIGHTCQ
jgi:hypothetical protein